MDIEGGLVVVAHATAAHIRFIRQNQRRRHGTDRHAGALVVVTNGRRHLGDILRRHPQLVQNTERHDGAALGMIHPVDQVADVVEITRDLHQLHLPVGVAHGFENIPPRSRHPGHVGKAVFGIAQRL